MHFSLSLLSEYLNINEGISQRVPSAGQAFYSPGDTRRSLLPNPKRHQLARTPPSSSAWNLEFVKYSFSSQVCSPLAREKTVEYVQ